MEYRKLRNQIHKIESANAALLMVLFRKYSLKIVNYSSHIRYINQCLREDLTPKFVRARLYSDSPYVKKSWNAI